MKHHHHLAWLQPFTELQHRRTVAGEGDLAPIREPIHQGMQIPEVFQFGPGAVLPAGLLQGALQGCHLGGHHQPLPALGPELPRIAVVAPLQIWRWRDLESLLFREGAQV